MRSSLAFVHVVSASAYTLVDNPIVADQVAYLDGSWTATSSGGSSSACQFEENLDWKSTNPTTIGHDVGAHSKEECCSKCLSDSTCFVAVYLDSKKSCWTKTEADASGGSYARTGASDIRVSCKKQAGAFSGLHAGRTITGSVPGDLLTDLQKASLIGDPLYELNFKNASIWNDYTWTYAKSFTVTEEQLSNAAAELILVFDGIKMGARISVNGKLVGTATDQFLRYEFPLLSTGLLRAGSNNNTLSVAFDPAIDVGGRFMSCTGGWDWAPYTTTFQGPAHTFSKGIWKSVYIATVQSGSAAITHVVPQIFYQGAYPTVPLAEGAHGGFSVDVNVHLWAPAGGARGSVCATAGWGVALLPHQRTCAADVRAAAGHSVHTLSLNASAADVRLWWPAGVGAQPMYNISVSFTASGVSGERQQGQQGAASAIPITLSRRVGFRHFALVTGNDTDPAYVAKAIGMQGTDSLGMFFRVNGAVVFSKGANMIPMEELEGRLSAEAHHILVRSAAAAGMNTLRVWGGGMFLPDAFYDSCDELGVMVYHDMQYAHYGHAPAKTDVQDAELRHVVRRLSHHPAIVLYDGCNECRVLMNTGTAVYATFVMTVVAEEDKSRSIWPSCPALGWSTGVDKLTARPLGVGTGPGTLQSALTTPDNGTAIETHGPYQHGGGFAAINGQADCPGDACPFDANIPVSVKQASTGAALPNVFASEFGCSVMSSFECEAPDVCTGGHVAECVGTNPMSDRNYPCDNIIGVYFGSKAGDFNLTGEAVFKKHLYQCMIGQSLVIKQNIETRRSKNSFGITVWQYNEIWPTGGWGSIEYGTPVPGQVIGGRWKPLQYWYMASLFKDVMATCGADQCYVKNDSPFPFAGKLSVIAVDFATGASTYLKAMDLNMAAGAGVSEWFTIAAVDGTKSVVVATVIDSKGTVVSKNVIPFATPQKMELQKANVKATPGASVNADGSVEIEVTAEKTAMYVTLTTLAQGRFSDNAFLIDSSTKFSQKVQFIPFGKFDAAAMTELTSSLRVEDVSVYM